MSFKTKTVKDCESEEISRLKNGTKVLKRIKSETESVPEKVVKVKEFSNSTTVFVWETRTLTSYKNSKEKDIQNISY